MSRFNLFVRENIVGAGMDKDVYDPKNKESQILVESDVIDNLTTPSSFRPVSANQSIAISDRVVILEENLYEYEIFKRIESGTTGTVSIPEGAEIRFGQYIDGQDCLILKTDSEGRPIDDVARTSTGEPILGAINSAGNYSLTGSPEAYPVAIIYQVVIESKNIGNLDLEFVVNESRPLPTHSQLFGRDEDDSHPISAITNLQTELDKKYEYDGIIGGATVTEVQ